jgi:iron complex outermembrane recepter protein
MWRKCRTCNKWQFETARERLKQHRSIGREQRALQREEVMKRVSTKSFLLAAMATSALTVVATPAFAQDEAAAEEVDSGEIIVTARRRDESLQDTPVAITAINTAMLENKASLNIGDLQGAAPGLLITQQNSGAAAANLSIRGLTYADIEKSQTPTVGVVVDGVTIGTNTGQLQDVFDVAQIEVLRGPQGTLFGANTIGGVVSITRTKPTMETGLKAELTYGKWNTLTAKAIGNVGNGDSLGLKLWYFHNETDGFYRNATANRRAGWSKGDNFGGSLLFKPSALDLDVQLTVGQSNQKFEPVVSNLTNSTELFCGFIPANQCNRNNTSDIYTLFGSDQTRSSYKAPEATLQVNFDAGGVKLTAITGWRHSKESQTQDYDGSSTDLYFTDRRQHYTQWSQELRLSGDVGKFDYVVGGYAFDSTYDLTQWSRVFGFNPAVPPTLFDRNSQHVEGQYTSYAFFGDFNWAFADQWRLSFGGRWSHDTKKLLNGFAPNVLINPTNVQASQFALVGTGDANFSKFTPKVGVDFRPNDDTMLYASWSRGYRSGGFSPRAATAATASTPFGPETVDSYEVGGKFSLADGKVLLNLAAYYSDYKDMQQNLTVPGGPTGNQTITGNVAGGAAIKGIEFDATFRPVDNLRLTAASAYMKSNFRNFVANGVLPSGLIGPYDYSANRLIYAPKFTASFESEYTIPTNFGEVVMTGSWRHISPYDEQLSIASTTAATINGVAGVRVNGNDPRVRTTTQDLIDASATVNFKLGGTDAYVRVFGRNLGNEKTTTHAFTVAGLWSFGMAIEPRTYGATIGIKF